MTLSDIPHLRIASQKIFQTTFTTEDIRGIERVAREYGAFLDLPMVVCG